MRGMLASLSPTRPQFPSVLSDHTGGLSASALSWGGDVDTGKKKIKLILAGNSQKETGSWGECWSKVGGWF